MLERRQDVKAFLSNQCFSCNCCCHTQCPTPLQSSGLGHSVPSVYPQDETGYFCFCQLFDVLIRSRKLNVWHQPRYPSYLRCIALISIEHRIAFPLFRTHDLDVIPVEAVFESSGSLSRYLKTQHCSCRAGLIPLITTCNFDWIRLRFKWGCMLWLVVRCTAQFIWTWKENGKEWGEWRTTYSYD